MLLNDSMFLVYVWRYEGRCKAYSFMCFVIFTAARLYRHIYLRVCSWSVCSHCVGYVCVSSMYFVIAVMNNVLCEWLTGTAELFTAWRNCLQTGQVKKAMGETAKLINFFYCCIVSDSCMSKPFFTYVKFFFNKGSIEGTNCYTILFDVCII